MWACQSNKFVRHFKQFRNKVENESLKKKGIRDGTGERPGTAMKI